jgi:thiol-disulfide isomerase/thioredoxin
MNNIIQLSDVDFATRRGKKGNLLCSNVQGISLLLYYTSSCPHCKRLFPIFKSLSKKINQCRFALINLDTYPTVAEASHQTLAPITAVPYVALYVNGKPFVKYTSSFDEDTLGRFVASVIKSLGGEGGRTDLSNVTVSNEEVVEMIGGVIPFNIVCDGELCYLTSREINPQKPSGDTDRRTQGLSSGRNEMYNGNNRMGGQDQYQSAGRGNINEMFNPQVQRSRQNLNQYSGM